MARDGQVDFYLHAYEYVTMWCHSGGRSIIRRDNEDKPVTEPPDQGRNRRTHIPVRHVAAAPLLAWDNGAPRGLVTVARKGADRLPGGADGDKGVGHSTHITSSRAALESFPPSERTSQV